MLINFLNGLWKTTSKQTMANTICQVQLVELLRRTNLILEPAVNKIFQVKQKIGKFHLKSIFLLCTRKYKLINITDKLINKLINTGLRNLQTLLRE